VSAQTRLIQASASEKTDQGLVTVYYQTTLKQSIYHTQLW